MNTEQCQYILTKGINLGLKCTIKKIFCNGLCVKHHKSEQIKKNNIDKIKNKNINNIKKQLNIIIKKYDIDIIELRNIINLIEEENEVVEEELVEEEVVEEEVVEEEKQKSKLLNLPYDILLKIIYKPCINKEIQLIFNKNIPYLYNEFMTTTKNIDVIKLGICQDLVYYEIVYDDGIYRYRNPRTEIWTTYKSIDEMYNVEIKDKIESNNMWSNKNNHYNNIVNLYNKILNKYKLYNKLFIKNILYNESYDTRFFILDDSNHHIKNILLKCYKYMELNLTKNLLKYDNIDDCYTNMIIDFKNTINIEDKNKIMYKRHKNQSIEDRIKWYIGINIYQEYNDIIDKKIDIVNIHKRMYKTIE